MPLAATLFPPTTFHFWDHHWLAWTPRHAQYESIEMMVVGGGAGPGNKLVWIFCSERDQPKRQVHYISDANLVRYWPGESYAAVIDLVMNEASALGEMRLAFVDKTGARVDWNFQPVGAALSPGELTDQSGHDVERFLLWFYRRLGHRSCHSTVSFDDREVAGLGGKDSDSFTAAYSRDVYVASVIYGSWDIATDDVGMRRGPALFVSNSEAQTRSATLPGFAQRFENQYDDCGALIAATHMAGSHAMRITFDPGIRVPTIERTAHVMRVAFDNDTDLFVANVEVSGESAILSPIEPAWARKLKFEWRQGEIECAGVRQAFRRTPA